MLEFFRPPRARSPRELVQLLPEAWTTSRSSTGSANPSASRKPARYPRIHAPELQSGEARWPLWSRIRPLEDPLKQRLTNLEKKITNVTTKFEQIEKCCKRNDEVLFRLENHAETLRAAMISLAKKIDVQTGRRPYE
uniref:14 kDa fusion protein n=1 Tax=Vaccinia virus (strain WR 65-16) TaxID=10247 RepID=VFUS_VACC6|nr:RecName: Full=14 kDa fusion protein [Vaccinia virus WR 65-16]AAA47961.1 17-kDa encoding protein [Vaccinia virus]